MTRGVCWPKQKGEDSLFVFRCFLVLQTKTSGPMFFVFAELEDFLES